MIKAVKRVLPASFRHSMRQTQVRVTDRGQLFFWHRSHRNSLPLPPVDLRTRVGSSAITSYLVDGQRQVNDLQRALNMIGQTFTSFDTVLEFGCGSGRQTRWLQQLTHRQTAIYGTDLDVPSIVWLQTNFPFGEFTVNGPQPPLPYPDEHFDLIFAVSVFTHLTEASQILWLSELCRVVRSGGVLLLTTHGPCAMTKHLQEKTYQLHPDDLAHLDKAGFHFLPYPQSFAKDYGGDYGMTYHSHQYVRRVWSKDLQVLEILPGGLDDHQDIVVLTKPAQA